MNKSLFLWLAILFVFSGAATIFFGYKVLGHSQTEANGIAVGGTTVSSTPGKRRAADKEWLTDYTLTERSGESFSSKELDGDVHVVSFFFATCPHYCTFQNRKVSELHKEFGDQGVKFVSITCDPTNDTPAALNKYAKQFGADENWLFLTGDMLYLRRIGAEKYQVAVAPQTHTERLIVVDRWGKIRNTFHWNNGEQIAEMKKLLAELLAEKSPPEEETSS